MLTCLKLLIEIFKKNAASLSERLERTLLYIAQYQITVLYKSRSQLFIVHLLSKHNQETNTNEETPGMNITINTTDSCIRTSRLHDTDEICLAIADNEKLSLLSEYVLPGWLSGKAKVQKGLQPYWSFRDTSVTINGIPMKGQRITIPASLKEKVLNLLHINHMVIDRR